MKWAVKKRREEEEENARQERGKNAASAHERVFCRRRGSGPIFEFETGDEPTRHDHQC